MLTERFRYILFFFSVIFLLSACNGRPENVLNQEDMTSFLIDLHKLDGSLAAKGFGSVEDRKNVYYYNALLKQHGITKAEFDSSLVWYAQNPKKFDRVYSVVIKELTALDEKVRTNYFHPIDSVKLRHSEQDIWPLAYTKYYSTKDSVPTQLKFTIKNRQLVFQDTYVLSFLHRIGKSNTAKNQQAVIKLHYANGVNDSVICKLTSDSLMRRYTIRLKADSVMRIDSITGAILNFKAVKGRFNARIDSIKLIRKYDSLAQDSLQRVLFAIENPGLQTETAVRKLTLRAKVLHQIK